MNILQRIITHHTNNQSCNKTGTASPRTGIQIRTLAAGTALTILAGIAATPFTAATAANNSTATYIKSLGEATDSTTTKAQEARQAAVDTLKPAQTLDNVVVTSQRQLVKVDIDKLSYDVQGDVFSKTATIMEMLSRVPLVTIDGDDNIKIKGSSDFKIYKNGHPDPAFSNNPKDILKAFPASAVKRIEVITEPGAKYDAEGVTAILNFVMVNGWRIDGAVATLQARTDRFGTNAGGHMTVQMGKLMLSAFTSLYRQNESAGEYYTNMTTIYNDTGNRLTQNSTSRDRPKMEHGGIDVSYEIDDRNLLTMSVSGYIFDSEDNSYHQTELKTADGLMLYKYNNRTWSPADDYRTANAHLSYQHKTRREGELFSLAYQVKTSRSKNTQMAEYENIENMPMNYDGYRQDEHDNYNEHTAQIDWVRPLSKSHKLETGAKYIHRLNKSISLMDYNGDEDADVYGNFRHINDVAAVYAQYLLNTGRWSARAGLRYEYSRLKAEFPDGTGEKYHKNLNDLVPSASVMYRISDSNSLKLSYSSSISRPGIGYLNPVVIETPTMIKKGNPSLTSARRNMLGLTFTHIGRKMSFNLSPYYNFMNNNITSVMYLYNDKKVSTYGNVLRRRDAGMSGYIKVSPWKGGSVSLNGNMAYNSYKDPSHDIRNSSWSGRLSLYLDQSLPWKLRLSTGGDIGLGHNCYLYGYNRSTYSSYITLQRSFLKDKRLTVRLNARNPIGNKFQHSSHYKTKGDYLVEADSYNRRKSVTLSVSLRLGNLSKSVKQTSKSIQNNDIVGGLQ